MCNQLLKEALEDRVACCRKVQLSSVMPAPRVLCCNPPWCPHRTLCILHWSTTARPGRGCNDSRPQVPQQGGAHSLP